MSGLPEGFADDLARVLKPSQRLEAAEILEAATMLDDKGLARFMKLFAARVRASPQQIGSDELRSFLQRAAGGS
jgi:hypothetical protein